MASKIANKPRIDSDCCPSVAAVDERPLLSSGQAAELMALFKVLANDTRLRMLHALVSRGELCVGGLAEALGMKPQAVSNQLQRLLDRGILAARRQGNNIYYRVINACVTDLLDRGLCLVDDECSES
jgi:DNA-binding transcriptional ArsR family regulator